MSTSQRVMSVCSSLFLLALPCAAQSQHSALLPQPRSIRYGNASIRICDLSLPTGNNIAREDTYALQTLTTLLQKECHGPRSASVPLVITDDAPKDALPSASEEQQHRGREQYSLVIGKNGIQIHGASSAGVFYATQTLGQLFEGAPNKRTLPYVEITDQPALPYRGFMYDTAHGGMPTLAEIKRQLDQLAQWKANQYYLYIETNIDLNGYPLLHRDSNLSQQDVREIVAYARQRHIDVIPCVELYGHLHDLFQLEQYSGLSALSHGGEANPADERILNILEDWLKQYATLFPSPWIHIGFDEPFELGRPGTRASNQSPEKLWLNLLQRMAGLATQQGKRPLFWADIDEGAYIFNKYPGLAENLPPGAVVVPWFYDARPSYDGLLTLFAKNRTPLMVATGISDWDTITPDFESTFTNIDGFLAAARAAGGFGMMNTQWSDSAQALHRQANAALVYGAVAAWQSQPTPRSGFFSAYAQLRYGDTAAASIAHSLDDLTTAQSLLRTAIGSETSFRIWDDPFEPSTLSGIKAHADELKRCRQAAETARENLLAALQKEPSLQADGEFNELLFASRILDFAGMKFLYAMEIEQNFNALPQHPTADDLQFLLSRETAARNHSRLGDLMDTAGELQADYSTLWLQQYKPYRLATAQARWAAELEYWRHVQASIWTLRRNFKQGDSRPTLEQALHLR